MTEQPQGTVSLLFSDIEGSTRLLQELGRERYADALALHRELLRKAFAERGGYEVDYEGDAFFVAFARADDAVSAAVSAQQALAAAKWPDGHEFRVRMGIHTGEPLAVPPKYVGLDVHKAARIMSAGHGGQVLLSQTTRDSLDDRFSVRDLGEHRLKDLLQPEPLAQLVIEGLPDDFPALKTLGNRPNNLPVQPNALIGREREIAEVVALLRDDQVQLVTLTGPGGTGKTRLALQLGAELLDEFRSGVFFVSLTPLSDPNLVVATIAQTLALREVPGEELLDTLIGYLGGKQMLLVVDNFEQVIAAAPSLSQLLRAAPEVKLLVTSRERLRIAAERTFEVPALELPDPAHADADALIENEAVALFVARAKAVQPRFALSEENAHTIAEICLRLDGLPLALELAAARIAILSPQALLRRLDRRLALLTGGARDAEERQQTLRKTIEWSYELLSEPEKTLFAHLSVFVDGCRLEAAEAVCDPAQLRIDLVDSLQSLVEKSLVRQRHDSDGEPRFWMLETIREYAAERCEESEDLHALQQRHADRYIGLAEASEPEMWGSKQQSWSERLDADHDNLRAALLWALQGESGDAALRLAGAMEPYWETRGHIAEGRRWLEQALAAGRRGSAGVRAKALFGASRLTQRVADYPVERALLEEAVPLYRQSGDARGLVFALSHLAQVTARLGENQQARALHEEAVATARALADRWLLAMTLNNLGVTLTEEGEYAAADLPIEESLAIRRALGEKRGVAVTLTSVGERALALDDPATAASAFEEALTLARELGNVPIECWALGGLGLGELYAGDPERAGVVLAECLALSEQLGDREMITQCLGGLAAVAGCLGDGVRAARLWGASHRVSAEIASRSAAVRSLYDRFLPGFRADHDPDLIADAWRWGEDLPPDEAVAYALSDD